MNLVLKKIYTLYFFLVLSTPCYFLNAQSNQLDSLLKVEKFITNDTNKIITLNMIASIYLDNNYPKALNYASKAYKLAEKINFEPGRIDALMHQCYANDFMGRYAIAQQQNFQLLSIFEKREDSVNINNCYNNIGIIHYYLQNYDESIQFTQKALNYYLKHDKKIDIATCYNNIANAYSDMENNDTALVFYMKALEIYK